MTLDYGFGALISLVLTAYLVYALVRPTASNGTKGTNMTFVGWIQILVFFALILAVTKPLGAYMYRVFEGARRRSPRARPHRARSTALSGVDPRQEQDWKEYTFALLVFSALRRARHLRHPAAAGAPARSTRSTSPASPHDLAFNTAASFTTNTNWQSYAGESTMSYLTQMAGLAWHNFTSAAAGIGVALALARGFTRRGGPGGPKTLGNFWVDLIRGDPLRAAAAQLRRSRCSWSRRA